MVEIIDKLGEDGLWERKCVYKVVVKVNDIKVGVVVTQNLYNEDWDYYKFIDGRFSNEKYEDIYEEFDDEDIDEIRDLVYDLF